MPSPYQLPVLLYHRIVDESCKTGHNKTYVSAGKFKTQLAWLKENDYETLTFRQLNELLEKSIEGKSELNLDKKIILTFDDGYADNYTVLFPLLKEYGFTAVIFLVTALTRNEWDNNGSEPALDLLSGNQVAEMESWGIEFGGHTQHHINLKEATVKQQGDEIKGCFNDLEHICNKIPVSFSYPYGVYANETAQLLSETGFRFGVTTVFGPREWKEDLMHIRRLEVRPKTTLYSFRRKVSGRYFNTNFFNYLFTS